MANYTEYANREEWLASRIHTLGASEVASALGMGFVSQLDLWKEKTGRKVRTDLSDNERVQYGTAAEEHLRGLFALQFKDKYDVEYHAYRVYRHEKYPFMTCTLDAELTDKENGERGIWECKTAKIMSKRDLDDWDGRIKQSYYCQVLHQLEVTQWDFVVLTAQLIMYDNNSEIHHYTIRADETKDDREFVVNKSIKFWQYVEKNIEPPTILTL